MIDFDDFDFDLLTDKVVDILGVLKRELAGGQEGFDADVDHKAAFDFPSDDTFDGLAVVAGSERGVPGTLTVGLSLGQADVAVLVFLADQKDVDNVANRQVRRIGELFAGQNALGFISYVDDDVSRSDVHDAALDDGVFRNGTESAVIHGAHVVVRVFFVIGGFLDTVLLEIDLQVFRFFKVVLIHSFRLG